MQIKLSRRIEKEMDEQRKRERVSKSRKESENSGARVFGELIPRYRLCFD